MLRDMRAHPHLPGSYRESRWIAWACTGWFRRLTGYTTGYTQGSDGVHRTRRRMTDGHLTKKENEVFLRRLEKRGG
jgi:hypothetical protein